MKKEEIVEILGRSLGTATKRDIIKRMIRQPEKYFYGNELAREINKTHRSVYVQIRDLVDAGILVEKIYGRMRLFRINKDNVIVKFVLAHRL